MDQEVQNSDTEVFGRCRCCLELGNVKDMWTPYPWDGANEIYGEMLIETFSITWDSSATNEVICEMCVGRLRDAHTFKREVLASEKLLMDGALDSESESVNEEKLSEMDQYEIITYHEEGEEDNDEIVFEQIEEDDVQIKQEEDEDIEYEEVEYLDDEVPEEHQKKEKKKRKAAAAKSSKKAKAVSIKQAPQSGRKRNYRMYTEATLRQCVEEAMSSTEPLSKVAARYGIPRKTLIARVYNIKHGLKPDARIRPKPDESRKHRHNARTILHYSTATPFKTHGSDFVCYFCNEAYTTISELRKHNVIHAHESKELHFKMASGFSLKLDVTDLKCRLCKKNFDSLEKFTTHIIQHGKIIHTDIKNVIIPYKFDKDEFKCTHCDSAFKFFKHLSEHMSAHYRNYECDECGKGFISLPTLRQHKLRQHTIGDFKCDICPKRFPTKSRLAAHLRVVHIYSNEAHKCWKCSKIFLDADEKANHELEFHSDEARPCICDGCERRFDTRMSLKLHKTRCHFNQPQKTCPECGMVFSRKATLDRHMVKHTGVKNYKCPDCGKSFGHRQNFQLHLKIHNDDCKLLCELCPRKFTRRYKWRDHMAFTHSIYDL
ncbi:zinc finger protein 431-like isoform X1 [Ostrinia furnacalis]|uniref:zinc finger protein 431-like isoform X1 n=1 Tax=Ostrinia furnacalis TaxID=93504 RepID=UPI00103A8D46|nr:zinc finger protein 431-like isoform X1 [Ostrinia furnacalis]